MVEEDESPPPSRPPTKPPRPPSSLLDELGAGLEEAAACAGVGDVGAGLEEASEEEELLDESPPPRRPFTTPPRPSWLDCWLLLLLLDDGAGELAGAASDSGVGLGVTGAGEASVLGLGLPPPRMPPRTPPRPSEPELDDEELETSVWAENWAAGGLEESKVEEADSGDVGGVETVEGGGVFCCCCCCCWLWVEEEPPKPFKSPPRKPWLELDGPSWSSESWDCDEPPVRPSNKPRRRLSELESWLRTSLGGA